MRGGRRTSTHLVITGSDVVENKNIFHENAAFWGPNTQAKQMSCSQICTKRMDPEGGSMNSFHSSE